MIVPDVNLLVYAHNESSRFHVAAREWWEDALNGNKSVLLPQICLNGFVRIVTHPKILDEPLTMDSVFKITDQWIRSDCLTLLSPGLGHYELYKRSLKEVGLGGKLTTDAYIAALAMETQSTLFSNDRDFARFPGLKWLNPLEM